MHMSTGKTVRNVLILNGWRFARVEGGGRRVKMGAVGEPILPYLVGYSLPDDFRDLAVLYADTDAPRDERGLHPTTGVPLSALGAPDLALPGARLEDVREAVRTARETLEGMAVECGEALRHIEGAVASLASAHADIGAALDVLAQKVGDAR